jgi:hypothetical protein
MALKMMDLAKQEIAPDGNTIKVCSFFEQQCNPGRRK